MPADTARVPVKWHNGCKFRLHGPLEVERKLPWHAHLGRSEVRQRPWGRDRRLFWKSIRAKGVRGEDCKLYVVTGGVLARRASFFDHSPLVPVFAPTSTNNLEYLLALSKNLAHPLHPVYDDGKGGGWKWWE